MLLLLISILLFLAVLFYMYKQGKSLEVTREKIHLPVDIEKTVILFLSDIHRREITSKESALFTNIDYIIIGGDLAEEGVPEARIKHNLAYLSQFGKVIFVWGNNDYEFGEEKLTSILTEHNVLTLRNSCIHLGKGLYSWVIAGVDDLGTEHADIIKTLSGIKHPTILVSHNPAIVDFLNMFNKTVVAVLSGHTHGGQIRLGPFGIAEKGGWKHRNGFPLFISNGLGTRKLPLRLGAKPQVHIITISGKQR